jgi:hypothetical protein
MVRFWERERQEDDCLGDAVVGGVRTNRQRQRHEQAKLVFSRYGERYFLRQVWAPGMDRGRELSASKAEQEFARSFGKPEIVSLLVTAPGMRRPAR